MKQKNSTIVLTSQIGRANVDETMKELETHGSFELPVETYTDNCEIFRSLSNPWHREMEIICIAP